MSGGFFNYSQFGLRDMALKIEDVLESDKDENSRYDLS